ncbi:MAG: tRNA (adenine-N1)-methyltransferase [Anaerolineales bacterium]|nr:tRNA (adenine-N1)-methyltransferase [Anaerolineales bacterium]WKZ38915.1 MAG: tRNA (adenine-N1)-methyltransferase [Anaerolineales bacterium]
MKYETTARDGDLAQLVGLTHKHFIFTLKEGGEFQSHRGVLKHDDLIGIPWGSQIFSHTGAPFFLLQPSLADILNELPRTTQILYPKDIGYILVQMGISSGQTVMEAGTGSGSMTIALASAVGAEGRVISYEQKTDVQNLARKNVERIGLASRVDFKLRDIQEGFDETDADAFFLDVQNPFDYIPQVRDALKPGGFFGTLLPTFNQVEKVLNALRANKFAFIEVCELLLRYYKPNPSRLRPADRMVAHTGFLVFGRKIEAVIDPRAAQLADEAGLDLE